MVDPRDASLLDPPARLVDLVAADELEVIAQPAVEPNLDRWIAEVPEHESTFRELPPQLDRQAVRAFCDARSRDPEDLVASFVASQIWGHGNRGYGPHRLASALAHPDLVPALQCAADELDDSGPVRAFEALCVVFELPTVGTAFGSKYLFFADRTRRALILDRVVAEWLRENTGQRIGLNRSVTSYELWLNLAHGWAEVLKTTPEGIELLVFSDALPKQSQWRTNNS